MSFKNEQHIGTITIHEKYHANCPLGKAWYTGNVTIEINNPQMIPDYCDVDEFVDSLNGQDLIIEDAVQKIYNYIKNEIVQGTVVVSCYVDDAKHRPVSVVKMEA